MMKFTEGEYLALRHATYKRRTTVLRHAKITILGQC